MNRINVACLAGFLMVLLSNNVPGADRHVRADLVAADGSGVIGVVEVTQMPNGGATVNVTAGHLPGNSTYTAYAYETGDCSGPQDAVGTFQIDPHGRGEMHARITGDLEDLGSIAVRIGESEDRTVVACASLR